MASSENEAIIAWLDSGWSFGLQGVQVAVNNSVSPTRKVLLAPSVGVGIKVTSHLVPFFTLYGIDGGTAFASSGGVTQTASGNITTYDGGLRFESGEKSLVRPYAEFGGGILRASLTGGGLFGGTLSGSAPNMMYGGGMRVFWAKRWGSDFGLDGFHVFANGGAINYAAVRVGIFFQSKRAEEIQPAGPPSRTQQPPRRTEQPTSQNSGQHSTPVNEPASPSSTASSGPSSIVFDNASPSATSHGKIRIEFLDGSAQEFDISRVKRITLNP